MLASLLGVLNVSLDRQVVWVHSYPNCMSAKEIIFFFIRVDGKVGGIQGAFGEVVFLPPFFTCLTKCREEKLDNF